MEIEKHLAELAQADPQARRTALENALTAEGLTPEIQECEADERRKAARNYLLYTADKDAKGPLFCAHYDAHPGSDKPCFILCLFFIRISPFVAK